MYINTYIHTYIHTLTKYLEYIHSYIKTYTHTYIHIHSYTHSYKCLYVCRVGGSSSSSTGVAPTDIARSYVESAWQTLTFSWMLPLLELGQVMLSTAMHSYENIQLHTYIRIQIYIHTYRYTVNTYIHTYKYTYIHAANIQP